MSDGRKSASSRLQDSAWALLLEYRARRDRCAGAWPPDIERKVGLPPAVTFFRVSACPHMRGPTPPFGANSHAWRLFVWEHAHIRERQCDPASMGRNAAMAVLQRYSLASHERWRSLRCALKRRIHHARAAANAARKTSISAGVPAHRHSNIYVGTDGQMRPTKTFCCASASITLFAGRRFVLNHEEVRLRRRYMAAKR